MDAAFLDRSISARRLEMALAFAAATGLTFNRVSPSQLVAREVARVGHANVDAFRRGQRVQVQMDGVTYDTTEAQLRLLRLLGAVPMAAFIRTCADDVAAFGRARKSVGTRSASGGSATACMSSARRATGSL